eukprot:550425-Pleurochrysis_carterae.AAC.1
MREGGNAASRSEGGRESEDREMRGKGKGGWRGKRLEGEEVGGKEVVRGSELGRSGNQLEGGDSKGGRGGAARIGQGGELH